MFSYAAVVLSVSREIFYILHGTRASSQRKTDIDHWIDSVFRW